MSATSNTVRTTLALSVLLVAGVLLSSADVARAQAPVPTSSTPSIIGGQVIGSGHLTAGASTGYPVTRGEFIFGLGSNFDLGVFPGLTYGGGGRNGRRGGRLAGLNQDVGLLLDVPLRFNLATLPKAAIALRVVPYFRIGQGSPSFGFGGGIGVRVSIPLPKIFSIVVGAETRAGFGSSGGGGGCPAGADCRAEYFEGQTYGLIGLETFFKDKWFFFLEHDFGGWYNRGDGFGGGSGLFNTHIGFGAMLH